MAARPHAERFNDLPEETKLFLEALTPEDIKSIKEGIALARATKTMGKFWKWTFIFVVTAFAGMATIGQSIEWLWDRLRGGH